MEQFNRHIKVSHRVVFPLELRLFNTVIIFVIVILCILTINNIVDVK